MRTCDFFYCCILWSLCIQVRNGDAAYATNIDIRDCSRPCHGGDVNYEITASVRLMYQDVYRGRTFAVNDETGMGPTLRVQPGQTMYVKLRNDLPTTDDTTIVLGPSPRDPLTAEDYWQMLQRSSKLRHRTTRLPTYGCSICDFQTALHSHVVFHFHINFML